MILFTYPFFVMLLGALFFAGRITGWGVLSLVIAYAGIAVIFLTGATASGEHVVLGAVLVLGCAFAFALYQLLAKSLIARMGSPIFTCIAMTSASAAVLLHFSMASGLSGLFDIPARIVGLGALLAIFSTVLPSFMLNAALDRISAQAVAVLGTLSPSTTIIVAIIVLGEPFTATDAIGTALVMAGVGLFTWRDTQRKDAAAR